MFGNRLLNDTRFNSGMSSNSNRDPFKARDTFDTGSGQAYLYRLSSLAEQGYNIDRFPYSIKVLLEGLLRNCDGVAIREEDIRRLASYNPRA